MRTIRRKATSRRVFTRRKRRTTGTVSKATKKYVASAIRKKLESKMSQYTNGFFDQSEDNVFNFSHCYLQTSVGTTDRGRIGNTIWGTKIVVKYKCIAQHWAGDPENPDLLVPEGLPPLYFKIFIIKHKSGLADVTSQWFKSRDRGTEFPVLELSFGNIQNGLNVLNTDAYTVLAYKSVKLTITRDKRDDMNTGSLTYRFPKLQKITLNENSTNVVDKQLCTPLFSVCMYPYWGTDEQWGGKWGMTYSIQNHYKD